MAKKIEKTNAARLLDRAKIRYDLVPYTVDEDNLAATHVAEELGEARLRCDIHRISDLFEEEFFDTKSVIYARK